jgi:superfamily II DNA/RNA helicase
MDAFKIREGLIEGYKSFTEGFVEIQDERIKKAVQTASDQGRQWPDPWLSLNPSFASGGRIDDLVAAGLLHPTAAKIFRRKATLDDAGTAPITLHRHQADAIKLAASGKSYVLTTGTGSGKSLAYIVPIVDRVLREGSGKGIRAIIVYPMNALANSQMEELRKFLDFGFDGKSPVTYRRYTGQESPEERADILKNPPDILLTNYVMLEYVLTRPEERTSLIKAADGLSFLVLDELHTYRGRQGADVAMLVRRVRDACGARETLQCVGTSATMSNGGSSADQKTDVGAVATRIFGVPIAPEQVVSETLIRATTSAPPNALDLRRIVGRRGDADNTSATLTGGYDALAADPLAAWIESEFGLTEEDNSRVLVRKRPTTVARAAKQLSSITEADEKSCATAIRATFLAGSKAKNEAGRPLFAFRLHQFLSKGGSVYVSAEDEGTRLIQTDYQVTVDPDERRLYPLAFCRECGQEYLMARKVMRPGADTFLARQTLRLGDDSAPDNGIDGYLYISSKNPWPADPIAEDRLPESWLDGAGVAKSVLPARRKSLPVLHRLGIDGSARLDDGGEGQLAAWIPGAFRFCLNCEVTYEQARLGEVSKLVTLDREGRSSAMAVIATRLVHLLESPAGADLDPRAHKLLTFVDNRQDAALQAGHVNDFVQVAQLRAALHAAVAKAAPDGVEASELGDAIVASLNLDFKDFAVDANPLDKKRYQKALHDVVTYRAIRDLQRGWRITLPNLEQTGLLLVEYPLAQLLAEDEERWKDADALLRDSDADQREEIITILLDEFRRGLAIDARELDSEWIDKLRGRSREFLQGVWSMPEREPDPVVGLVTTEPKRNTRARNIMPITGAGAFGRWLRRPQRFGRKLTTAEAGIVIESLLRVLQEGGLITEAAEGNIKGHRLKLSTMTLRAGTGEFGAADPLRRRYSAEKKPRVIAFFRDLYRESGRELAGLHAMEHTAQVRADDREKREKLFRDAELKLLFCSPTMELGVDIADLNAVAMRNVPPTPANYAQRSGRAGRSGQPALVLTYCATGNAHDSYYFDRSELMVAGQVQPPRLDFANEDLVRSHVHAVWLAETLSATSGGLGKSMSGLLAMDAAGYPLAPQIADVLRSPAAAHAAKASARSLVAAIGDELAATPWWSRAWSDTVIDNALESFDRACDRWRELYKNAVAERDSAHETIKNPVAQKKARELAQRRYAEAQQRIEILLNDGDSQGQSDFYTLRYLASEGFLPGYSFPRLPLAAFIPGIRKGKDNNSTWLQRSRFLAISEFGPDALIYHEGARYQVKRVALPRKSDLASDGDVVRTEAQICEACGYLHERSAIISVCENCGSELGAPTRELMQLQSVITRRRERISADEEERNRQGFELVTTYRFADGGAKPGHHRAVVQKGGHLLAEVAYGDGATVRVVNRGRRNRAKKDELGFWLDLITGEWLTETKVSDIDAMYDAPDSDADDMPVEKAKKRARVVPFVEDRRNIAVLRWAEAVSEETATTLQYAIERGIEATFQLEDSELTSERLSDPDGRGRLLLVEAAEGGAGVLRRLQAEPDAVSRVAQSALEILHVNAMSGEDEADACTRGCYRCLLSYGNQRDHELIDRRLVVDFLKDLASASTLPTDQAQSALFAEPSDLAVGSVDFEPPRGTQSPRAAAFQEWLATRGHRNPAKVAEAIEGVAVDFVFDGPELSKPCAVIVEEVGKHPVDDSALQLLGFKVVTVGRDEDFELVVGRNADVFGEAE